MWDWLNQNKEWVFSGAGITALGVIWWAISKLGSKREPATSPSVNQSPSITVSPTIHVTPSQAQAESPKARPAIRANPKPGPNLICLGPQTIRADFFHDAREQYFHTTDDKEGMLIVAVCFRNEPKGVRVEYVRVNVVYKDSNGQEIGTGIPRASWLGEHMDMMDFDVGDSHCAVL